MAKTPQEWRSEWLSAYRSFTYWNWIIKVNSWYPNEVMRDARLAMSNCVLGYAMARGWTV